VGLGGGGGGFSVLDLNEATATSPSEKKRQYRDDEEDGSDREKIFSKKTKKQGNVFFGP